MHLTCLDVLDPLLLPLCTDGGRGGAASSLLRLFVPWVILIRKCCSCFSVSLLSRDMWYHSSLQSGRFLCCFYHFLGVQMGANRNHFANIFYFLIIGLIILCMLIYQLRPLQHLLTAANLRMRIGRTNLRPSASCSWRLPDKHHG
jgi:hypothetical protein